MMLMISLLMMKDDQSLTRKRKSTDLWEMECMTREQSFLDFDINYFAEFGCYSTLIFNIVFTRWTHFYIFSISVYLVLLILIVYNEWWLYFKMILTHWLPETFAILKDFCMKTINWLSLIHIGHCYGNIPRCVVPRDRVFSLWGDGVVEVSCRCCSCH